MKKSHIIAVVVIAACIGLIVATAGDASTYVSFNQAYQMASNGNNNQIHVVGDLKKDAAGTIVGIEKSSDNLSFSFILIDEEQKEQKVYYNEPMPPDFARSEKVVVIGGYQNNAFVANKILLKCPSKYQEEKINASI
ncbi:MAG: cytochrome c maturation protein CcmE [Flammeovirgaceae bacterium]|nr:cytochrome c maturation protein CcmE [Flammeovirgaceae bacterium]